MIEPVQHDLFTRRALGVNGCQEALFSGCEAAFPEFGL